MPKILFKNEEWIIRTGFELIQYSLDRFRSWESLMPGSLFADKSWDVRERLDQNQFTVWRHGVLLIDYSAYLKLCSDGTFLVIDSKIASTKINLTDLFRTITLEY